VSDADALTEMLLYQNTLLSLQPSWIGLFGANRAISTLKCLSLKKYSFQKLTKFSQWNNVLGAPASNIHGLLYRHTCVYSIPLNRPLWNKMTTSAPWEIWFAGSFPFKN
jgi:hypothetical protein